MANTGKGRLGRKLGSFKNQWKNNKDGFRKDAIADATMTGVNAAAYSTGAGQILAGVTGKDVNDLVGYEMKTELGKDVDKVSNTVADTAAMVAPVAVGIGVTAATGSPVAGQAAMQGTTAVQGIYDSIDTRETDSYLDPDMAAGSQQILNQGTGLAMGQMKYGGKMKHSGYGGPKSYADGGQLTEFNEGGTHEKNPNGGVPQGPGANVEEGETKVKAKDYIFSDRITASKGMLESLNLSPKWAKKSFSEISKLITKKYDPKGQRDTDSVTQEGINRELERLILGQEAVKIELGGGQQGPAPTAPAPMAYGGPMNYAGGGKLDPPKAKTYDEAIANAKRMKLEIRSIDSRDWLGRAKVERDYSDFYKGMSQEELLKAKRDLGDKSKLATRTFNSQLGNETNANLKFLNSELESREFRDSPYIKNQEEAGPDYMNFKSKAYGGKINYAEGGELSAARRKELEKEYAILKDEHERGRQAIGTNDKETLNEMKFKKPYNSNDLSGTLSELQRVRKELGYGTAEEASYLLPHVGQQIRGAANDIMDTNFAYGGKMKYFDGGTLPFMDYMGNIEGSPGQTNLPFEVSGYLIDGTMPNEFANFGMQERPLAKMGPLASSEPQGIVDRAALTPLSPTVNAGEPGMTKSASGEGINVNYGDATNAFMGVTSAVNSMANIRDLKKNKPTPKDLNMFDAKTEIRNPKIDYRSIFRANEQAEGRARRSIASNSKNAGDLLSSNIALNEGTQRNNATAYTGTQEVQAKIDMAVDQTRLQKEVGNETRSMTVQDWNDADNQRWTNALIEARNQMGNNMRQTAKNQMNLEAGKAVEGKGK